MIGGDGIERVSSNEWCLILTGPRKRISRKRKKDLKGSYLRLVVAVAIDTFEKKHGPHHAIARRMRRMARECVFRVEQREVSR